MVIGVIAVSWPERIVLGVLGRRTDEEALVWALRLARRWDARLDVIAGYHPPVGMYPHIVTHAERDAHRRAVRRDLARRVKAAVTPDLGPIEADRVRLVLVPENHLERTLVSRSREADMLLFSIHPTLALLAHRQQSRAQRIAEQARCPASLGPGMAVSPAAPA